jgi:hypothetical protein
MESKSAPQRISDALAQVAVSRQSVRADAPLAAWLVWAKQVQCKRFELTYADLLAAPQSQRAVRFFLNDLYAARDFSRRDAQFARIANTIERVFPREVAATAALMAQVHQLSEHLDQNLARALLVGDSRDGSARYVQAWQALHARDQRLEQLRSVIDLGSRLDGLTRRRGLRTALMLMRAPARAAGLSELQAFLEQGFDAFVSLGDAPGFLRTVQTRETAFLDALDSHAEGSTVDGLQALHAAARTFALPD